MQSILTRFFMMESKHNNNRHIHCRINFIHLLYEMAFNDDLDKLYPESAQAIKQYIAPDIP